MTLWWQCAPTHLQTCIIHKVNALNLHRSSERWILDAREREEGEVAETQLKPRHWMSEEDCISCLMEAETSSFNTHLLGCCMWGDVRAAFGSALWEQSWWQRVFIRPSVCIIDAHYLRHGQLSTSYSGGSCQVNVSLTSNRSNRTDSASASVQPDVFLFDKWAWLTHCTRSLSPAEKVCFY